MSKIEDLRWIRLMSPDLVPTYLIEQVRDRDYSVEEFFKYHRINCMQQTEKGIVLNPFSHLYVLADKENQVKGVLWFCIDPLSKDIIIQTFSMDKEYWYKGQAVRELTKHIKHIKHKANLNKIYWITNYPKHSMRYGFTQSKSILMEYSEEKNGKNHDGKYGADRDIRPTNPTATAISRTDIRSSIKPDGGTGISGHATVS